MANSRSGDSVTDRLVRILESFTPAQSLLSTAEIGRRAGLPSSSAYRLVDELVAAGLLERDVDGGVRVGMRLWELSTRSSYALWLRQAALGAMEDVQREIGEHTQLVLLEDEEALCVERLSAPGAGENITEIAGRLPLHASSSGLVLLAHADRALRERVLGAPLAPVGPETVTDVRTLRAILSRVRREGHVVAAGTVSAVSTGVAVPVRDPSGEVIAALSVILPRGADPAAALRALRAASTETTLRLGRGPGSRSSGSLPRPAPGGGYSTQPA
jgi:DNA-binding IclR family transcriptional regulator